MKLMRIPSRAYIKLCTSSQLIFAFLPAIQADRFGASSFHPRSNKLSIAKLRFFGLGDKELARMGKFAPKLLMIWRKRSHAPTLALVKVW